MRLTSKEPGAAAKKATVWKERLYKDIMVNHHFLAFAVETLGTFSVETKVFIDKIGKLLNIKSGNPNAKSHFVQKISTENQRSNAAAVIGTIPSSVQYNEIFYL